MKKNLLIIAFFLFCFALVELTDFRLFSSANAASLLNSSPTDSSVVIASCMPEEVGMNSYTLQGIDFIAENAIRNRVFPGCQVVVLKNGKQVYNKSFGNYTYETVQHVTDSTLYDLASLSKTTGTLLGIMKLYDNKMLDINDKASEYLPFLKSTNKESITIKDLLFHQTGLPAYINFYTSIKNPTSVQQDSIHDIGMRQIANTQLGSKTYLYSCINFILLKEIIESITELPMDEFLNNEFYCPLGLKNMCYKPLVVHKKSDIAPTLKLNSSKGFLQGEVHDPAAAYFGGISGNAGLFASARDVAVVYQLLLNNGEFNGKQYLCEQTCQLFTNTVSASGRRGLGFDKPVPTNLSINPCSKLAPQAVYGHTGYTGTCCWVDPVNQLIYVFLSNRTYPSDGENKLAKMGIRPKIQEVIYQSIIEGLRKYEIKKIGNWENKKLRN